MGGDPDIYRSSRFSPLMFFNSPEAALGSELLPELSTHQGKALPCLAFSRHSRGPEPMQQTPCQGWTRTHMASSLLEPRCQRVLPASEPHFIQKQLGSMKQARLSRRWKGNKGSVNKSGPTECGGGSSRVSARLLPRPHPAGLWAAARPAESPLDWATACQPHGHA